MNSHKIVENYKNNDFLRNNFFDFIKHVFGNLDFREWFERGFWNDQFIPYSIVEDGKIIANVSISKLRLLIDGEAKSGIQIGSVGTLPEYRGQGLARTLMNYVIDQHEESTDLFFLFANETVLDFYPRFGFRRVTQTIFTQNLLNFHPNFSGRKLDIDSEADMAIIKTLVKNRAPLTQIFGARDHSFITFWHLLNVFPENIIYLDDADLIVIATESDQGLHIFDVIFTEIVEISEFIGKVIQHDTTKTVFYHFPPDQLNFRYDDTIPCDDPLFVRGDFPIDGRKFKFPVTAQT
jgi:GNAT superfamily N-acetyltransferase